MELILTRLSWGIYRVITLYIPTHFYISSKNSLCFYSEDTTYDTEYQIPNKEYCKDFAFANSHVIYTYHFHIQLLDFVAYDSSDNHADDEENTK